MKSPLYGLDVIKDRETEVGYIYLVKNRDELMVEVVCKEIEFTIKNLTSHGEAILDITGGKRLRSVYDQRKIKAFSGEVLNFLNTYSFQKTYSVAGIVLDNPEIPLKAKIALGTAEAWGKIQEHSILWGMWLGLSNGNSISPPYCFKVMQVSENPERTFQDILNWVENHPDVFFLNFMRGLEKQDTHAFVFAGMAKGHNNEIISSASQKAAEARLISNGVSADTIKNIKRYINDGIGRDIWRASKTILGYNEEFKRLITIMNEYPNYT